jgi:hypothetical protein
MKVPFWLCPQLAMYEASAKPNPGPQHLRSGLAFAGVLGMRRTTCLSGRALSTRVHVWGISSSGLVHCSLLLALR